MHDLDGWRVHRSGTSGEVVLAVDFPMTGRSEAGFAELAQLLDPSLAVWETLPPPVGEGAPATGAEFVGQWLADVRESGLVVRGLLSFCAGAAYLGELSDGIARWQDEAPAIVMIDPEVPAPITLKSHFLRALEQFAVMYPQERATRMREDARALCDELGHDIDLLLPAVTGMFREVGLESFAHIDIDPRHGSGLLDAFDAFAKYVVGGTQLDATRCWDRGVALSSNTPTNGLNLLPPEADRAGAVGEEIRFDIVHAEMLGNSVIAAKVDELLARTARA
ncbi:hypothetical protein [Streptomyces albireticuli]|uniref:hypothetical protein n=1 Tax=Streptomyces albireticuli TaxID=1940 RepID=UPI00117C219A|nr:hypothetical protein [Streptomyces albireticuli]MCD9140478.1 hypothetical protein [Streptomyces albireticuli]MCD9161560.1 hypothetical protein [Streptomyces albireticuli]MCD9192870.1 hypothetical protein [Streptomyces albireticuli]